MLNADENTYGLAVTWAMVSIALDTLFLFPLKTLSALFSLRKMEIIEDREYLETLEKSP